MRARLFSGTLAGLLLFGLICIWPPKATAAATLVQTTNASASGVTSVSATYASAVTANDLLVVICGANAAAATITGPSGFSTARNDAATSSTPGQAIFYKIASGTESTVSCTTSASVTLGVQIYEYSGIAVSRPLDATNTTASSGAVGLSASSGSVTTTYANDLLLAGVAVNGGTTISSWSNSFTQENQFAVTAGKSSLRATWGGADFQASATGTYSTAASIGISTAWVGQIAAFRINTPTPAALTGDMVNGSGVSIASPSVVLSAVVSNWTCTTVSGSLATSSQQIEVSNSSSNPAWSVAIGATSGPSSLWSTGTYSYDYNDSGGAGCSDGDSDGYAGQLTITPSAATATAQAGCTTTGLSLLASATGFSSTNSITLASDGTTADTGCYWLLKGFNVSQTIPAGQHSGTYALNMTITVVAN